MIKEFIYHLNMFLLFMFSLANYMYIYTHTRYAY